LVDTDLIKQIIGIYLLDCYLLLSDDKPLPAPVGKGTMDGTVTIYLREDNVYVQKEKDKKV